MKYRVTANVTDTKTGKQGQYEGTAAACVGSRRQAETATTNALTGKGYHVTDATATEVK